MCGILAVYQPETFSRAHAVALRKALSAIDHRGPDGEGITLISSRTRGDVTVSNIEAPDEQILSISDLALAHKRLSIIDTSSAGHQPMKYHHGIITFNGEIYNYIEIREELKAVGYIFHTGCDTEVILAAYDRWQEKCLEKFNGMFAFVLYDAARRRLFVANDRFGVKPLYYYQDRRCLIFASEVKQFQAYGLPLTLNSNAVNTFLTTYYVDYDEQTFFNEIRRFPKAHYAYVELGNVPGELKPQLYYRLGNRITNAGQHTVEAFGELLEDAVRIRMRSDVPVGFASSGGLDSSSILYKAYGLLKKEGVEKNIKTFSAIFPGLDGDESRYIRYIEDDLGVSSFYTNPLDSFSVADFERHIYHQDMPVASTSYYAEWCVARLVSQQNVKVLLIGQGGDELLAGYHHHFYRYCRQLILQGKFRKYLSELKSFCELKSLDRDKLHRQIVNEVKYAMKFKMGLKASGHKLENHWNSANKLIDLLKIDFSETMLPAYLRSDDRDAMAFGLETRHPFLDYRLVDFCFSLPDDAKIKHGWQKFLLREAMAELPETIRYRKDKKGYTTPQDVWLSANREAFEDYTHYIPEPYRSARVIDPFLKYTFGAWCKVNKLH